MLRKLSWPVLRQSCPCAYLIKHYTMKICGGVGEWRYSSTILDVGLSWRRVVSFTTQPLYPRGKSARYPLGRSVGGPQNRSRRCGKEKILPLSGLELRPLGHPAQLCLSNNLGEYGSIQILGRGKMPGLVGYKQGTQLRHSVDCTPSYAFQTTES
jgi:hypothetical protein